MLDASRQKLRQMSKLRIAKFLIIFALTGSSSVFVSNIFTGFIEHDLAYAMNPLQQILLISVLYQFLLFFFCFAFGELPYVIKKFRKITQLFRRTKS